ncbi:MAG: ATP-binding protein [Deltaproteobacteria bacterium]
MRDGRYRVLLIEDLDADAVIVRRSLDRAEIADFEVVHVLDLASAVDTLAADTFDIILTDLALPDSDGIETVKRVRAAAPETPVVVLTSSSDDRLRLNVLANGADDFVSKDGVHTISLASGIMFAAQRSRVAGQLRAIVERNADGAVVVDEHGVVLYVNNATVEILGRPAKELIGVELGLPLDAEAGAKIEVTRPSGESRSAELRTSRITWDGQLAVLVSIRDISDRQRSAELERRLLEADRLASIGQLAAGVAHLINNPASFIQANSTLMLEEIVALEETFKMLGAALKAERDPGDIQAMLDNEDLPDRFQGMREMAEDTIAGIQRIAGIVRDLGAFARLQPTDVLPMDVARLAEQACDLLRSSIVGRARLEQKLESTPELPVDATKMVQAIVNVLLNAVWAVDQIDRDARENEISITTRTTDEGVCVSIEDNGCGIDPKHDKRIFEPFFTTREHEGARGLGLSLALETLRKHGGRVIIDSEVGRGTRVDLILPFEAQLDTADLGAPSQPEPPAQPERPVADCPPAGQGRSSTSTRVRPTRAASVV